MTFVLFVLIGLGLLAVALMRWAQARVLNSPTPTIPGQYPAVSILKPLKGMDASLEENLRSFFELDYPNYEIILGAEDFQDPALYIARKVAWEYPHVASRIVVDTDKVGLNPKVNNLTNLSRRARYERILISDSNIRAPRSYLRNMVAQLEQPGVGLVSSPFRASDGTGIGARLEGLHLHSFVMGGVCALNLVEQPCVVGKSMLMKKSDLQQIGGFQFLSHFLGEDQVCGEEIHKLGLELRVSNELIDNVQGTVTLKQFFDRQLRWAQIRRRMSLAGYFGELLLNPVLMSIVATLCAPNAASIGIAIGALLTKSILDYNSERSVGIRYPLYQYPALVLMKEMVLGLIWVLPFLQDKVHWRGQPLRVGKRTELQPVEAPMIPTLLPASPTTQKAGAA